MPPASRLGDLHACPMQSPAVPPVPHVGGPITGPCVPTVLIGGLPAAKVGDFATCTGPPDSIIAGSSTVFVTGIPLARIGDACAHGGRVTAGCPTVIVGG
ncbi:MAG TPA: PAAR domain-containing protein [Allosphingosinicella sp.]|nr:PAAR domain-containing protein [Allosphingosinicella sp.]